MRNKCAVTLLGIFVSLWIAGCGGGPAALVVKVTATNTTVDGADSVTVNASVTNDRNGAGVKFAVSAGSLTNATTSSATFTAPAATSSAQTVTVTATSISDATKSGTVSITVPAKLAVTTTSSNLTGSVGTGGFSVQLQASGGIPPYKNWAISSTGSPLPACLTLNSSTGALTFASNAVEATCAAGSPYTNLVFTFQDSGTPTALSGTSSALSITLSAAPAISFTGTLPTGSFNQAYSGSVAATGGSGSLTYTMASGSLPTDLTLNAASGTISGTPQAADVGTFNFTVKAADGYGDSATKAYQLVVNYPQLTITTGSMLPGGYGSTAYSQTLAASGGNGGPYTWTVTSGGATLTALNLSVSSAGVLSGTPPAAGGAASFTVQAADSASNKASVAFSLTVKSGLVINTASPLPNGYGNAAYSQTLTATGGSGTGLTWSVTSGASSLAALNLALSSAGVLSGTPPAAGGSASFTVKVTDSASNTATANFSLTIKSGVTITAPSLSAAYPGTPYSSAAFTAAGGNGGPYTWSMAAAGGSSVPAGFSINPVTGVITAASPVNAGNTNATYNVVITASDAASNSGSANATITIESAVAITTAATLPPGTAGVSYSTALAASGGSGGYTWQLTAGAASLANVGLTFNTTTGAVSGATPVLGSASFTVTATDSQSHVSAPVTFSVTINNQLKINQTSLPAGNQGSSYSQTLTASGGSGSGYTFAETTSTLAGFGLSLASNGTISGTPTQTGTVSFTAKVTDSSSHTATQNLSIQIDGSLSLPASNSLPNGYTNVAYTGSVSGSGGSGSLALSITAALSPSNGTLSASAIGNTVNITGTPAQTGTESITVKLTDSTTGNSISQTYSFTISNPTAPSLPATNPPSATVNQSYSATITATGGLGPNYTWTVNGSAVPTNGTSVSIGTGLSISNTGNNMLSISGTPTAVGPVAFNASVKDNTTSLSSGTQSYTVQVNSAGSQVSGQIFLTSGCSGTNTVPSITVSINTNPVQHVTTDVNGNYSFGTVPNGTYTITPSITGVSSVFYPASHANVVVNNNQVSGENFSVALAYSVKGTVSYSGTKTGQVYLNLNNSNCGGSGGEGTSIPSSALSSGGAFTINGVPPGTYTLLAYMDNLGNGAPNSTNPSGSVSVTVSSANITGVSATLVDPTVSAPTTAPTIQTIAPTNLGVVISYKPIKNSNGVEAATSYTLEWSTSSTFTSPSSITLPAKGSKANVWFLNNSTAGISGSFTNGTAYYFRVQGSVGAGTGPWGVFGSPTAVTIGMPSGTGYFTVSGTAVIPADITPAGPLYVGFYDQNTGTAYATRIAAPTNSSAGNPYTVSVPSGSNYFFFGILDQNNDGQIDAGDVSNTDKNNNSVTISGNLTGEDETLPDVNSTATAQTQYNQNLYWNGTSSGTSISYNINFNVRGANKLPVAVQLVSASNPNVIIPVDISNLCQGCGSIQFNLYDNLATDVPVVNDTYTFNVTYSDGSTGAITAKVTGVLGASALATNLEPQQTDSTSVTPTFTWTYPSSAASYTYQFYICCNGNTIWSIPGNNSSANSFTNLQIPGSLTWGVDPTDSSNIPTVTSLTSGTYYNWSIQAQDSNGNSAQNSVWYQP